MVPSWTETLIECGVNVVGRTRFCIHPQYDVKAIPVVGGTKEIDWEKVSSLKADILILDREENPKSMADESPIPFFASHVTCVEDVPRELLKLSEVLRTSIIESNSVLKIQGMTERWEKVLKTNLKFYNMSSTGLQMQSGKQPLIIEWIKKPKDPIHQIIYVIWKSPYMAVTKETFVGSMLKTIGLETSLSKVETGKLYPDIQLEDFDPQTTLFLFSSEPFPFHKKVADLKALNLNSAIVDGEHLSWFGLRSLKFLESLVDS